MVCRILSGPVVPTLRLRRCAPRDSVLRRLAHERWDGDPPRWRSTIRRYRLPSRVADDTARAAEPGKTVPSGSAVRAGRPGDPVGRRSPTGSTASPRSVSTITSGDTTDAATNMSPQTSSSHRHRDGTGPARLLEMVGGRSEQAFKAWQADRPPAWRSQVDVVAIDGFTGFTTAEVLPDAVPVMTRFYVVCLTGDALDRCRRRVQQSHPRSPR